MPDPLRRAAGAVVLARIGSDPSCRGLPDEHRAGAVVDADDERGRSEGLVVQADKVSWTMLDALVDLALYGSLLHKEIPHQRGRDCRWCRQAEAVWHTALIDPLLARRGLSATELHNEIRREARRSTGAKGSGSTG